MAEEAPTRRCGRIRKGRGRKTSWPGRGRRSRRKGRRSGAESWVKSEDDPGEVDPADERRAHFGLLACLHFVGQEVVLWPAGNTRI